MKVMAKPGTRCPMEGKPRDYIGDAPVEVPESSYYLRLIADGSLIRVEGLSSNDSIGGPPAGSQTKGGRTK